MEQMALDWQGWVTIVTFVVVFALLIREYFPAGVTMFGGACLLTITGVLSPHELLVGFSRPVLLTFALLFMIARAIEVNGILAFLSRKAMPTGQGYVRQLATLLIPLAIASAFFANTPIVLMMTPVILKWARENGLTPSRYLIPLSFAVILGGACTMIGTSSNLVIAGLLREYNREAAFEFFDYSWIGVPVLIVGFAYLFLIGRHLVPTRRIPTDKATEDKRQFTAEFRVGADCPLIAKSVRQAGRLYFPRDYLIEIRRNGRRITSPSPAMVLREHDRLIFACDIDHIANLHAIKGLTSLDDPRFELDPTSPHFAEVVVANSSLLIGRSLRRARFRSRFDASVIAVYRQGKRVAGPVGDIILHPGDTLLLLSNRPWVMQRRFANDLYSIQVAREVPVFIPRKVIFVTALFALMIVAVTLGLPLLYGCLLNVAILLITRHLTVRQAARGINWYLLLLIASAFAFAAALLKTGVAALFARGVLAIVGENPHMLIGGIFLVTMVVTEVVTNVAAALLLFPIGIEAVHLLGYSSISTVQAVAMTVAIGASCSFLTPIGYQTNTIVYGPGGYRFLDYARVGALLSLIELLLATWLIPIIWPLS